MDQHIIKIIDNIGLVMGFFGSLFFAYGLLGKAKDSFLRKLIRYGVPGLLGVVISVPLSILGNIAIFAVYGLVLPIGPLPPFDAFEWIIIPAAYGGFFGRYDKYKRGNV